MLLLFAMRCSVACCVMCLRDCVAPRCSLSCRVMLWECCMAIERLFVIYIVCNGVAEI